MEERRRSQRSSVQETAYISHSGASIRCLVTNISPEGAALEVPDTTYIPSRFQLMTETDRVIRNCKVVWIMRDKLGVAFEAADVADAPMHTSDDEVPLANPEILTHTQRQFMQYLRDGNWVPSVRLPDSPKTVAKLLNRGWIERQGIGSNAAYRITASGLAAKTTPLQIHRKR
jgi:PilZ domain